MKFAVICVLSLVVITAIICGVNPQMHKRIVISDYKYKVVDKVEPAITETKVVSQSPVVKVQEVETVSQTKVTPVSPVAKTAAKVQTVQTTTVPATPLKHQSIQTTKVQTPIVVQQKTTETKPVLTVLTPQQETILWNQWHSNLQNKIMDLVPMPPIAQGVLFKFYFRVDKYGKITNIKSWSTDPKYNPIAIQYINPVIRNLQGTAILKFPEGSNRESTLFEGNIKISNTSKYSTANDYNDIETVKH